MYRTIHLLLVTAEKPVTWTKAVKKTTDGRNNHEEFKNETDPFYVNGIDMMTLISNMKPKAHTGTSPTTLQIKVNYMSNYTWK